MPKTKVRRARDHSFQVMATAAERAAWEAKAKRSQMTLSAWVRAALDHAPVFAITMTSEEAAKLATMAIRGAGKVAAATIRGASK